MLGPPSRAFQSSAFDVAVNASREYYDEDIDSETRRAGFFFILFYLSFLLEGSCQNIKYIASLVTFNINSSYIYTYVNSIDALILSSN